jgi:hypothetical protein
MTIKRSTRTQNSGETKQPRESVAGLLFVTNDFTAVEA